MKARKENLLSMMQKNNLNISGFAKELGVSRGTISMIIHGKRNVGGKIIGAFIKKYPKEDIKQYFF